MSELDNLRKYYQKQLASLKERYRKENEISFIKKLEGLVENSKNLLLKSKEDKIKKIEDVDSSNSRSAERTSKFMKKLHNDQINFNEEIIKRFIKDCKPESVEVDAPNFKEFEIE